MHLVFGILLIAVAIGLWKNKSWAKWSRIVIGIIDICISLRIFYLYLSEEYLGIVWLLSFIILIYDFFVVSYIYKYRNSKKVRN